MTTSPEISLSGPTTSCVIALHCSLGSGRQWARLADELGGRHQLIAPDLSGYGNNRGQLDLPTTLAKEVDFLSDRLTEAAGPIHLVGHSYGGAVAFKIATDSPFACRVRSLTLIEPVLPTLLRDDIADRRLHDRFVGVAHAVYEDLWNGSFMEAIDKFTTFWNGSSPTEQLSAKARLRLIEHVEKLAFDFMTVLAEDNVTTAAQALRVPTLLFSGGLSPYLTQRIVHRLASVVPGADARHLPAAGHMLPISRAPSVNREIVAHILHAERAHADAHDSSQPFAAGSAVQPRQAAE